MFSATGLFAHVILEIVGLRGRVLRCWLVVLVGSGEHGHDCSDPEHCHGQDKAHQQYRHVRTVLPDREPDYKPSHAWSRVLIS